MKTRVLAFLSLLVMSAACEQTPPEGGIRQDKPLAAELKMAQENISIDGKHLTLTANLWRDFMPSIGEADNSMHAVVKVACSNRIPIPQTLKLTRLMVVKGDSVWVVNIENSERSDQQLIQAGAKYGPEWSVGEKVDVVVEIYDGIHTYYLRKGEVSVEATH